MDIKKLQKQVQKDLIEEKELIVQEHLRNLVIQRETLENKFDKRISYVKKCEKQLLEEDFHFSEEEGCGFNLIFND